MSTITRTARDLKPGDIIDTPAGEATVVRVESCYVGPTIGYDRHGEVIPVNPEYAPRGFDPAWRILHIQTTVATEYGPDPVTTYFIARFPHEVV